MFSSLKKMFGLHDIEVTDATSVSALKVRFENSFGIPIRVYKSTHTGKGSRHAPDDARLGDLALGLVRPITIKRSHTVADVEQQFNDKLGIGIQIMNRDGQTFASNDATLETIAAQPDPQGTVG